MKNLISTYNKKKKAIKNRLKEFEKIKQATNEDLFSELCFCILTPQSKAVYCDEAIRELRRTGLLFNGRKTAVRKRLQRVRFPNNKTLYLIAARKLFKDGKAINVRNKLDPRNILKTRDWLAKSIKGLGYKEASHFLRNIGLGKDIAILDAHILRNLKRLGVVNKIPVSMSKKTYLDIEEKMRRFSGKVGIPLEELDLLFWSNQTGFIFK